MDQRPKMLNLKLKLLQENTGGTLQDIGVGDDFSDGTRKSQATIVKTDKRDFIRLRSSCTANEITNRIKETTYIMEEYICKLSSNMGLRAKICKELEKLDTPPKNPNF